MRFTRFSILLPILYVSLIGCGGGSSSTPTADTVVVDATDTITDTTPDTIAPVITIIGLNPINIEEGTTYNDEGATAEDDRDGSINVTTEGDVNTDVIGSYLLTYTATDSAGNTSTDTRTVNVVASGDFVTITGVVTYDKVPSDSDYIGLDYDNITQEHVKSVVVEAIDSSNTAIAFTRTNALGQYALSVPHDILVKIRVSAKILQAGTPSWDVKVVDNTNDGALYVMEGSLISSGVTDSQRDLHAPSGWSGSAYTSKRVAAPFAILDSIYSAISKVLSADQNTVFPPLNVNWSVDNVASSRENISLGQIITSHYVDSNLYILGDADSDTDEYDDHVVTHEWGHYYEDKFSRSDSIGGSHGAEDHLDIRVAFGEGWGNAFSAMALDDPIYFDTMDIAQSDGFFFDIESGTSTTKGWYSESSIERILYDLYDSTNDGSDSLSFGFGPIHQVFIGAEKVTPAFTSIFTFITALKAENGADAGIIDTMVSSENIALITDIYGVGRTNLASYYPYKSLNVGSSVAIALSDQYGTYNKLSNRKYIRFTIATTGIYTIRVEQTNGTNSDPDFYLFDTSPFRMINSSIGTEAGVEQKSLTMESGEYLLDVADFNNISNAQFTVTIN